MIRQDICATGTGVKNVKQSYRTSTSGHRLTKREREILRLVVQCFVDTAGPIGSRFLSKHSNIGLSPASIRNIMSDLEEYGYLNHPYTSAGRVPTELGYRTFVDELMDSPVLADQEKKLLMAELDRLLGSTDLLLRESSRLLGRLSNLLGVVLSPKLSTGILNRIEVVRLSSSRAMFIVSLRGGLVKTIVLELESELNRKDFERVVDILNERLSGLSLQEIRQSFETRVRDLPDDRTGIVRLILEKGALLFSEPSQAGRLQVGGAGNIMSQPEFQEPDELKSLISLLEDEDFVVHLLEDHREESSARQKPGQAQISIGREHSLEQANHYSVVTASYQMGNTEGTIGIIGPTRMDYQRVIALVETMANLLNRPATPS